MELKLWRAVRGVASMLSDALGAGVRGEAIYRFWQNVVKVQSRVGEAIIQISTGGVIEPPVVKAMVYAFDWIGIRLVGRLPNFRRMGKAWEIA